MIKSILILGTNACRSFELQDAILRSRMDVDTHVRHRSDDQDWTGADLIFCSEDSPDLPMLLDFIEQRKPATRVVILNELTRDLQYCHIQVSSMIQGHLHGKLFLAA